jgi:acetolactate synthase-1/3 small subunit
VKKTFIITTLVEHKPGVLSKVSSMFWRRNYNIESIAIGAAERKDLARMTIAVKGEERDAKRLVGQLEKLVDVLKATMLDPDEAVIRELALIKVRTANSRIRSDVFNYVEAFRGRTVDLSPESIIVELVGSRSKIDAFLELTKKFEILEVSRTGETALLRGPDSVILND